MPFITHIGTASPKFKHSQLDILEFMLQKTELNPAESRMLKLMYKMSGIETRYSVLSDFNSNLEQARLFNADAQQKVSIEKRLAVYDSEATKLAVAAVKNANIPLDKISHVISISCTGLRAPGLDIELVKALDLAPDTFRTSVNFMGCYAAIHGLKLASALCAADPSAQVLLVSVELCTLHFQSETKIDFLTSNLLFADGAAAVLISGTKNNASWELHSSYSRLYLEAEKSMGWELSSQGFLMTLSQDIPELIENNIADFLGFARKKAQIDDQSDIKYLIHPGGRKILEATEKALGLKAKQGCVDSYEVLKQYGNMSSATLLFILEKTIQSTEEYLLMAGFGPGISMESMTLKKVKDQ
jgi:predicted naringenin-chalcone synthase